MSLFMSCQNRIGAGRLQAPLTAIVLSVLVLSQGACSTTHDMLDVTEVEPWQRGVLARDDMQVINDAMEQTIDDHIYFSREGSTGGVVVQGGGCGCN